MSSDFDELVLSGSSHVMHVVAVLTRQHGFALMRKDLMSYDSDELGLDELGLDVLGRWRVSR